MPSLNFLMTCLIVVLIPGTDVVNASTKRCIYGDDACGVRGVWPAGQCLSPCSD